MSAVDELPAPATRRDAGFCGTNARNGLAIRPRTTPDLAVPTTGAPAHATVKSSVVSTADRS